MADSEGQPDPAGAQSRIDRLEAEISRLRHDVRSALSPAMIMADVLRGHSEARVARAGHTINEALVRAVARLQATQDLVPPRSTRA
jgi:hypothetical protein